MLYEVITESAGEAVASLLYSDSKALMEDYTSDIVARNGAHYLMSWIGITLESLDYPYDATLNAHELMQTLYSDFTASVDTIKNYFSATHALLQERSAPRMHTRDANPDVIYAWQSGMEYGRGFSDVTQSIIQGSNCLEEYNTTWYGSAEENYEFVLVQSEDDLSKNLNISGSISLGYEMISGS